VSHALSVKIVDDSEHLSEVVTTNRGLQPLIVDVFEELSIGHVLQHQVCDNNLAFIWQDQNSVFSAIEKPNQVGVLQSLIDFDLSSEIVSSSLSPCRFTQIVNFEGVLLAIVLVSSKQADCLATFA
jgi:hypothetical protein